MDVLLRALQALQPQEIRVPHPSTQLSEINTAYLYYALLPVEGVEMPIEANRLLVCFFDGGMNVFIV